MIDRLEPHSLGGQFVDRLPGRCGSEGCHLIHLPRWSSWPAHRVTRYRPESCAQRRFLGLTAPPVPVRKAAQIAQTLRIKDSYDMGLVTPARMGRRFRLDLVAR